MHMLFKRTVLASNARHRVVTERTATPRSADISVRLDKRLGGLFSFPQKTWTLSDKNLWALLDEAQYSQGMPRQVKGSELWGSGVTVDRRCKEYDEELQETARGDA